jgi:Spy/CpxP family protein refolding chaperone
MRDLKAAVVPRQRGRLAKRLLAAGVFAATLAGAAFSVQAQGHPGHGPGPGGPGMAMFAGPPRHIDRAVDRMLRGIDASPAQRTQIKQIAVAAAADLKASMDAARGLHAKGLQIFMAPTVDAAAAEALRQQMLAQHDQVSKRMLQAMLDIANVLTPEQRAKLGERVQERQSRMKERMRQMQQAPMPPGPASEPSK